ncbi:hypothetical protein HZU75_01635 [Chitinibacter fontanus]|uniref:Alkaline phytoceramidase n=1 Tax=Chitinibacter fontanus TaxID=1737446 RepID=A0A7D5V7I8_9NEIS|nr:hypothetical protein [Chitinibacter fontanus]QLI80337.1 hypothetical protein HZU75_01635 [Chitinibacter fontanus]
MSLFRRLPYVLPSLLILALAIAMLLHGPILQLPNYHHFADRRAWLSIPNAADVLSNLGFAFAGAWGVCRLWQDPQLVRSARVAYYLFFSAVFFTSLGSGWYHLAPDNARLIFDRIPIAIACAGLLAAAWQECYGQNEPRNVQLGYCALLAVLAYLSVWWWQYTDVPSFASTDLLGQTKAAPQGLGDLRPYLLLQMLPLILIPLLHWQAQVSRAKRLAFASAILLYVFAKVAELQDHQMFHQLSLISGHTLKHLLATAAAGVLVYQLKIAARP